MGKTAKAEKFLLYKNALIEEFKLEEKKVSQAWLDCIDCDPDPNNPDHWDFLLYSKKDNYYVNLKFFPTITVEPTHTTNYTYGRINVKKDVSPETVIWYLHNIMDKK